MCILQASLLILLLVASASIANGQARRCKIGSVSFTCPAGLKLVENNANYEVFAGKDVAVFISPVEGDVDTSELVSTIATLSLLKLNPHQNQSFDWKPLKPSNVISKFETDREGRQGFNGTTGVALDYRVIQFKSIELLVGYLAALGEGDDARAIFARNLPADTAATMSGCGLSAKLIYSVTGERFSEDNSPCSLDVRSR
jgi:hypothetical protein